MATTVVPTTIRPIIVYNLHNGYGIVRRRRLSDHESLPCILCDNDDRDYYTAT